MKGRGGEHAFRSAFRPLLVTTLPLTGVFLAELAMDATDTAMVGRLGAHAISAVGLGGIAVLVFATFCVCMPGFVGTFVAEAAVRGDKGGVAEAVRQGFWAAIALSLCFSPLGFGVETALNWSGQDPEISHEAGGYAIALSAALLPWLIFYILDYFVTALGRPTIAALLSFVGVLVNAAGNYLLIYGKFGFPALGVLGSGVSSLVTAIIQTIVLAVIVDRGITFREYRIFRRISRPNLSKIYELLCLTWPRGIAGAFDMLFGWVVAVLLGRSSSDLVAASQIAFIVSQIAFAPIRGLGLALTLKVAELRALDEPSASRSALYAATTMATSTMIGLLAICLVAPLKVISLFLVVDKIENQAAVHWALIVLPLVVLCQFPRSVVLLACRALIGLRDGGYSSYASMIGQWIISLPLGLALMTETAMGPVGLFVGEFVGLAVAGGIVIVRFLSCTRAHQPFKLTADQ